MGACLQKRPEGLEKNAETVKVISPEEKVIVQHEAQHSFAKLDFKELLKTLKSVSSDGALSSAQLKRAFLDLQISIDDLTSPDSATFNLLQKAKNEKKLYELRKLTLLSIFLGKGRPSDKAEWLFRQYDADASEILESSEFDFMLNDIFDVSARMLPALAIGEGVNSLTKEQCDSYSELLLAGIPAAKNALNEEFVSCSSIGHQQFLKLTQENPKFIILLNSSEMREFLRRYEKVPRS